MAKLNGVKTEEQKVSYRGNDYELVRRRAEAGDLVLSEGGLDVKEGNFYKVEEAPNGRIIMDDVGDERTNLNDFKVYAKKGKSILKVGDKIKVVDAVHNRKVYNNGDILTIRKIDANRSIYVEEFSNTFLFRREVEKYVEDEKTTIEYKKGDKIKVVRSFASGGTYKNGDVLTVDYVDDCGDIYVEEFLATYLYSYEVEKYEEKTIFKVGDSVLVLKEGEFETGLVGTIGKVTDLNASKYSQPIRVEFDKPVPLNADFYEEGDLAFAQKDEPRKFIEGDSAVVKDISGPLGGFIVGDIVKIVGPSFAGMGRLEVRRVDNLTGYCEPNQLSTVEDAESPKFKLDDTVKLIKETSASCNDVGDVGVITEVDEQAPNFVRVEVGGNRSFGNWSHIGDLEHYEEEEDNVKIGEKIKVVDAFLTFGRYKNGDILTVKGIISGGVEVEEFESDGLADLEFEKYRDEEDKTDQKINVGDKVILRAGNREDEAPLCGMYNGKEYEVTKQDDDHPKYWIQSGNHDGGWASRDQLVLIEDRREKIEVGDLVSVVKSPGASPVGTVLKIIKVGSDSYKGDDSFLYGDEHIQLVAKADKIYER